MHLTKVICHITFHITGCASASAVVLFPEPPWMLKLRDNEIHRSGHAGPPNAVLGSHSEGFLRPRRLCTASIDLVKA